MQTGIDAHHTTISLHQKLTLLYCQVDALAIPRDPNTCGVTRISRREIALLASKGGRRSRSRSTAYGQSTSCRRVLESYSLRLLCRKMLRWPVSPTCSLALWV